MIVWGILIENIDCLLEELDSEFFLRIYDEIFSIFLRQCLEITNKGSNTFIDIRDGKKIFRTIKNEN